MKIPEHVIERAVTFASHYSNMKDEEEIRSYVTQLIEQKVLGIACFGGIVVWKE